MIHLDTTFLVDLLRESAREKQGRATAFLGKVADEPLAASVHAVCELHAGAELSRDPEKEREKIETLCRGFEIVYPPPRFPLVYARLLAPLERAGERIGAMDLLIATAAVIDGAAVVTKNVREFRRVRGLTVIDY